MVIRLILHDLKTKYNSIIWVAHGINEFVTDKSRKEKYSTIVMALASGVDGVTKTSNNMSAFSLARELSSTIRLSYVIYILLHLSEVYVECN